MRLLGVTGSDLIEKRQAVKQLDLFSYEKDAKRSLYSKPLINYEKNMVTVLLIGQEKK